MKKLIIAVIVVVTVTGGLYGVSQLRMSSFLDGERDKVVIGDLVIPVSATGPVEPKQIIPIKSKAGGQVMAIHVIAGQMVTAGQTLVELDPVDETRNVKAREADVDRTQSLLDKANNVLVNAKLDLPLQTDLAAARLDDAKARFDDAEYRYTRLTKLRGEGNAGDLEFRATKTAFLSAEATRKLAETERTRAHNNETILFKNAEEDVKQAEAALDMAKRSLEEANLRLTETTVRAPKDGMVYSIMAREGEMVQGGTSGFTGGTLLMVLADTTSMFVMAEVDEADIGTIRRIAPDHAKPGQTRRLDDAEAAEIARKVLSAAETDEILDSSGTRDQLLGRAVEITVEAYRDNTYRGVIEQILPEPRVLNNVVTFNVRIRMAGDDLEELLGLQADLEFTTDREEDVVLVKNDALHSEGRDCFVYVPKRIGDSGPWGEKKVPVKIGKTDGTYTRILSGLSAGDEVWTKRPRLTQKEREAQEGGA